MNASKNRRRAYLFHGSDVTNWVKYRGFQQKCGAIVGMVRNWEVVFEYSKQPKFVPPCQILCQTQEFASKWS
jgi:hypothetical protein